MTDLSALQRDRGAIYGDPYENHAGIGAMWMTLLQPHAQATADGYPVPAHVVALCMAALKINRARRVHHSDNYDDAVVYLRFADEFQRRWEGYDRKYHRIYVAGPYTADTTEEVEANVQAAALAARVCMERGHDAHCPHAATAPVAKMTNDTVDYERWMRLDLDIIRHWATGLLWLGPSPGSNRERELAEKMAIPVWTSVDQVPDVT